MGSLAGLLSVCLHRRGGGCGESNPKQIRLYEKIMFIEKLFIGFNIDTIAGEVQGYLSVILA